MDKLAIRHDGLSPLAEYGLNHFLFKHGIDARINDGARADIEIRLGYSERRDNKHGIIIQFFPTEIQKEVKGHLEMGVGTLPLFEVPQQLVDVTNPIATFRGDNVSYPCISLEGNRLSIGFDLFREVGHILSGNLETLFSEPSPESQKLMKMPIVDSLEELFFAVLNQACRQNGINIETKPLWPESHEFAVCLTHDVDKVYKTYQYIPSILKHIRRRNLVKAAKQIRSSLFERGTEDPYWTFDKIMLLEKELGGKSTFFWLDELGKPSLLSLNSWILFTGRYKIDDPAITGVIRKLHENGWEIGLHGSYNSFNNYALLKVEKERLEKIIESRIRGTRQHYLNFDPQSTFEIHQSLGFEYDSTLGFRKGIGFRRGTCFPFHPLLRDGQQASLLEIPLVIMDSALPSRDMFQSCIEVMKQVQKYHGVLTLLWHQRTFYDEDFPGMTDLYIQLLEEARRSNAWIVDAHEISEWLTNTRVSLDREAGV